MKDYKKTFAKIILSLSVGIIVSQVTGNIYEENRYYIHNKLVSEYAFEKEDSLKFKREHTVFNTRIALTSGLVSSASLLVLFFLPDLFSVNKKK